MYLVQNGCLQAQRHKCTHTPDAWEEGEGRGSEVGHRAEWSVVELKHLRLITTSRAFRHSRQRAELLKPGLRQSCGNTLVGEVSPTLIAVTFDSSCYYSPITTLPPFFLLLGEGDEEPPRDCESNNVQQALRPSPAWQSRSYL